MPDQPEGPALGLPQRDHPDLPTSSPGITEEAEAYVPMVPLDEAMKGPQAEPQERVGPELRVQDHQSSRRRGIAHAAPGEDEPRQVGRDKQPAVAREEAEGHEHAQID